MLPPIVVRPDPVVTLPNAVVPPLATLKMVLPDPVRVRFFVPLSAPPKVTTPEPAAMVASLPSVQAPIVTALLVVVRVEPLKVSAP